MALTDQTWTRPVTQSAMQGIMFYEYQFSAQMKNVMMILQLVMLIFKLPSVQVKATRTGCFESSGVDEPCAGCS